MRARVSVVSAARALPRTPSGGGAAASSRARPDGPRGRARRRTPAPRCGAACRDISRDRPRRRRTRPWPRARRWRRPRQLLGVARDLHAAPAAARRRLDQHRIADLVRPRAALLEVGDAAIGAGHAGHAEALHGLLGGDLVAHDADMLGGRADEDQLVLLDDLGELGVLRQEAVAGVDRLGAGDLAGGDDRGNVEIAARRAAGRCTRSHRRGAHASRRRRRWSGRRPS
jgi:hypothetical protein